MVSLLELDMSYSLIILVITYGSITGLLRGMLGV